MNRERLRDAAREYLGKGFSVLPLDDGKVPTVPSWTPYQSKPMEPQDVDGIFRKHSVQGVGIICGKVSGNLEVVDVDSKHIEGAGEKPTDEEKEQFWQDFFGTVCSELPDRAEEFLIVRTRTGGFHIYYRVEEVAEPEGETEEEKEKRRKDRRNQGLAHRPDGAKKSVLLETRGEGGYVVAPPSLGYDVAQGSYDTIPTLTLDERRRLHEVARSFDSMPKTEKAPTRQKPKRRTSEGLAPWEDYDENGDVLGLLQSHGWTVKGTRGSRVFVLRPGHTDSKTSGDFHTEKRIFKVWSTSTVFEAERGYRPSHVYAVLECNGDFSEAARRLRRDNYGDDKDRARGEYMPETIQAEPVPGDGLRVDLETRAGDKVTIEKAEQITQREIEEAKPYRVRLYYTAQTYSEHVASAVKLLLGLPSVSVLVSEVEDLDTLKGYTPEAEISAPVFLYNTIRARYEGEEVLTAEQSENLMEELVEASWSIRGPLYLDRYKNEYKNDKALQDELGLSPEAFQKTVDKLKEERKGKEREEYLRDLTLSVRDLTEKGRAKDAIETLKRGIIDIESSEGSELAPPFRDWEMIKREIAETPQGLRTGYSNLDEFVRFSPGALTLIGGRPSHGKTALLLNFCLNLAQAEGLEKGPVYFFTYEEPTRNLYTKLFNILQGEDLSLFYDREEHRATNYEFLKSYIRTPQHYPGATAQLAETERKLKELVDSRALVLVDANRYKVEELSAFIEYQSREEKIRAVLVDYVQKIRTQRTTQDRRTEVGHVSDVLLQAAVNSGLPFLVGAQMNRDASGREPSLENLKEAGNLEEDANTVLSVFNPHREETDPEERERLAKEEKTVTLKVRALKNREGEVNRGADLVLDKMTQKITDLDRSPRARIGDGF
jgi:replicative DNA helicase